MNVKRWKGAKNFERNTRNSDLYSDVHSAGRSLLEKEKDFTGMGEALF